MTDVKEPAGAPPAGDDQDNLGQQSPVARIAELDKTVAELTAWREKASAQFLAVRTTVAALIPDLADSDADPVALVEKLCEWCTTTLDRSTAALKIATARITALSEIVARQAAGGKAALATPARAIAPDDQVLVRVTEHIDPQGPTVRINGRPTKFPVGQDVITTGNAVEVLKNAGIKFEHSLIDVGEPSKAGAAKQLH